MVKILISIQISEPKALVLNRAAVFNFWETMKKGKRKLELVTGWGRVAV